MELPFTHTDVTTVMSMIDRISENVERIRQLLEDENGEEDVPEENR
jgi:hypothetical protein